MKTYKEFRQELIDEGFVDWWNKGRNVRIPNENQASWKTLLDDGWEQRQHISRDPKSAWNPFRGMPGYGTAKSQLNPRIRAINNRRASQGKSPLSMDKVNPGGAQTGPAPDVRQVVERPLRTLGRVAGTVRSLTGLTSVPAVATWAGLEGGFPSPTARYDQVTGPNAYYNNPKYTGPSPTSNLTQAQLKNNQAYAASKGKYYSSTTGKTYASYADALKDPAVSRAQK